LDKGGPWARGPFSPLRECRAEQRTKFVFIRWIGNAITPMQRAKAVENKNRIRDEAIKVRTVSSVLFRARRGCGSLTVPALVLPRRGHGPHH
jgi:hypothetical protein